MVQNRRKQASGRRDYDKEFVTHKQCSEVRKKRTESNWRFIGALLTLFVLVTGIFARTYSLHNENDRKQDKAISRVEAKFEALGPQLERIENKLDKALYDGKRP